MQTYFEQELAKLRKRIIKMLNLVGLQLDKSFQLLLHAEVESIELIKNNENKIDKLDLKIDKLCQRIFALAQPVATDLRFIMSSLRIDNELERIGDIAYEVMERAESVCQFPDILQQYKIEELSKDILKIHNQILEAYTNNNSALAAEIIQSCKLAEENCKSIFNDIVANMTEKSQVVIVATDLILITRDLERAIGHFENVAESIIFIAEGKIVKHPGIQAKKNIQPE